jgi:mannose-1-phosphate guanylyltransferase
VPAGRLRALVLAAGLGTRLRPLTDSIPKPLLPVLGVPILGHTLARLAAAGCEAIAVNLHYLGDSIRDRFGEAFEGIPLTWSEEPEILGTGGALFPLRGFFAPADLVLLVNGDSLCLWPFDEILGAHRSGSAAATLLFTDWADPRTFGGGVGLGEGGEVLSFRPGDPERGKVMRRLVFAGAHVFAPFLLDRLGPDPSDIVRDLYSPLLAEGGRLGSVVTSRSWHDLGTPRRFLEATLDWAREGWMAEGAEVEGGVQLREVAIEAGARIGRGARVERSVLLPGARIGEGSVLREVLLGPGVQVPPGSRIEAMMITARDGESLSTPLGDPA